MKWSGASSNAHEAKEVSQFYLSHKGKLRHVNNIYFISIIHITRKILHKYKSLVSYIQRALRGLFDPTLKQSFGITWTEVSSAARAGIFGEGFGSWHVGPSNSRPRASAPFKLYSSLHQSCGKCPSLMLS